jgi:phage shock protein PspC (stress-responsive transcriptional regulator)
VEGKKKFVRDMTNNVIGGVCSGLANYIEEDVTIIRVITCLFIALSFPCGFIIYGIFWVSSSSNDDFDEDCFP